jgi:translation initiation factor IF-1
LVVGSKVSVLWDNPHEWFNGIVTKVLPGALVEVLYEDGDIQRHRLLNKAKDKTWKLLN